MNWVWANSPTSGNERLVLLALADACSRDDGTGCWPSAATIARKANISDRTVRRVIARLEADGHVRVHRGGGRAGATNSYTVVTGIHSPGQAVTPDILSGGDTGDTPPRTQPCPGTPDTAVSPDPPPNHQRTAARAGPRAQPATAPPATAAGTGEFFGQLAARSPLWRLTAHQRRRLAQAVAGALAAGWTRCLGRGCRGEHGRDPQPWRRAGRPALPRRAPAQCPAAAGVVRPVRPADPDAGL
jgi:hypothetical protein